MTETNGDDFAADFHAAGQAYADSLQHKDSKADTAAMFAAFIQNQLDNQEN